MERVYKQVEGHSDLARDSKSHAIINRNTDAYEPGSFSVTALCNLEAASSKSLFVPSLIFMVAIIPII